MPFSRRRSVALLKVAFSSSDNESIPHLNSSRLGLAVRILSVPMPHPTPPNTGESNRYRTKPCFAFADLAQPNRTLPQPTSPQLGGPYPAKENFTTLNLPNVGRKSPTPTNRPAL